MKIIVKGIKINAIVKMKLNLLIMKNLHMQILQEEKNLIKIYGK